MSNERDQRRKDLDLVLNTLATAMVKVEATIHEAATPSDPVEVANGSALDDARRRAVLLVATETYGALAAAKRSCLALFSAQGGALT